MAVEDGPAVDETEPVVAVVSVNKMHTQTPSEGEWWRPLQL